ncbi:hypothetical protein EDB81DRAFT_91567 [Dactylonectria macrodidyma]|uniref:Uncharacterized protein n=1 Tax=Dactylonectria macrodidyma TaxID=307937 RepID=A0A9P9IX16_9HYPO|nr:hypothetical protein EDB81DRAFT_91567 [Dactylonectria macrodidyma]
MLTTGHVWLVVHLPRPAVLLSLECQKGPPHFGIAPKNPTTANKSPPIPHHTQGCSRDMWLMPPELPSCRQSNYGCMRNNALGSGRIFEDMPPSMVRLPHPMGRHALDQQRCPWLLRLLRAGWAFFLRQGRRRADVMTPSQSPTLR